MEHQLLDGSAQLLSEIISQVRQTTSIGTETLADARIQGLIRGLLCQGEAGDGEQSKFAETLGDGDKLRTVCESAQKHAHFTEEFLPQVLALAAEPPSSACERRYRYLGLNNDGVPVVLTDWMWGEFLKYPGGEEALLKGYVLFMRMVSLHVQTEAKSLNPPDFVSITTGGPPPLNFARRVARMRAVDFPERVARICLYGMHGESVRGRMIVDCMKALPLPASSIPVKCCATVPELCSVANLEPGLLPHDALLHSKPPAGRLPDVTSQRIALMSAPEVVRWMNGRRSQEESDLSGVRYTFVDLRPPEEGSARRSSSVPCSLGRDSDPLSEELDRRRSDSPSCQQGFQEPCLAGHAIGEDATVVRAGSPASRSTRRSRSPQMNSPEPSTSPSRDDISSRAVTPMPVAVPNFWGPPGTFTAGPPGTFTAAPAAFRFVPIPFGCHALGVREAPQSMTEIEALEARARQLEFCANRLADAARCVRNKDPCERRHDLQVSECPSLHGKRGSFQQQRHQAASHAWPRRKPLMQNEPKERLAASSSEPQRFPMQAWCFRHVLEKSTLSDDVWRQQTLGAHLAELRDHDPSCIFIVRRLAPLGFQSRDVLFAHFSRFGVVTQVLVPHSKAVRDRSAKTQHLRIRPGSFGFVVMADREFCQQVFAEGREHSVLGHQVTVEAFKRTEDHGSGSETMDDQEQLARTGAP